MMMYVFQYDDSIIQAVNSTPEALSCGMGVSRCGADLEAWKQDAGRTIAGRIEFKEKLDPKNGWTVPLVTGHKYKFSWGNTGVDFEEMKITLSDRW
jgi:hypothetical protein